MVGKWLEPRQGQGALTAAGCHCPPARAVTAHLLGAGCRSRKGERGPCFLRAGRARTALARASPASRSEDVGLALSLWLLFVSL